MSAMISCCFAEQCTSKDRIRGKRLYLKPYSLIVLMTDSKVIFDVIVYP